MSYAEVFLLTWAVIATALAVFGRHMAQRFYIETRVLRNVVCEVASGELVATKEGEFYTIENDDFRMVFRREK